LGQKLINGGRGLSVTALVSNNREVVPNVPITKTVPIAKGLKKSLKHKKTRPIATVPPIVDDPGLWLRIPYGKIDAEQQTSISAPIHAGDESQMMID